MGGLWQLFFADRVITLLHFIPTQMASELTAIFLKTSKEQSQAVEMDKLATSLRVQSTAAFTTLWERDELDMENRTGAYSPF